MIRATSKEPTMNVIAQAQFKTGARRYQMSDAERKIRIEAAAAFRVAHHYKWNLQVNNHITVRLPDQPDHFLMNPHGLGWDEVTASNLATVRQGGEIVSHDGIVLGPAGLNFHSGILRALPHINCTIHVHARPGVAVSATKQGLVIVDQSSMHLYGEVGVHDFEGFAEADDEVPRILRDLGDKHCLIMWNHGLLAIGRTIAEAFLYMRRLVDACELQIQLMSMGTEIRHIPEEVLKVTREQIVKKRKDPRYAQAEWDYHCRLAERLDPSFAD
jgi:ribulose-5-phosphate 4-epimerase/fuculose-1-phosphate aldolase